MKDKINPPPEYKIGDYVTNNNKTALRSIYRYHDIEDDSKCIVLEFLAGVSRNIFPKGRLVVFPECYTQRFRVATRQELIDAGIITKSVDFITEED